MAHPMYGIDAAAKKYPNFDKALEKAGAEIEGTLWSAVGEMGILHFPAKIIAAVEKGIDGTDAEKEAVMIGALLTYAPFELQMGANSGDYGAPATAVLQAVTAQDKDAPHSEGAARVAVTAATALTQSLVPMIPPRGIPGTDTASIKAQQAEHDKLFVPQANAPKLAALYEDSKQRLLDAMAGKKPAAPAPKSRKPPGPR